jgi:predicted metal-dependent hydrolase
MPMTTPDDISIMPRNLHFRVDGAQDRAWLGGDPIGTAVFNALSLTFPQGERLFMDAVRTYRGELSGKLLADANAFIAQEAIHSREHVGLNGELDPDHYPLAAIDADLERRLSGARNNGPLAMLAVTITLEHFTAMLSDLLLRGNDFLVGAPDDLRQLWRWHAMEETEHKAVAFDVFQQVAKDWKPSQRYRLRAMSMIIIGQIFVSNVTRYASQLLVADGMKPWRARARVLWYLFGKPGLFRMCGKAWRDWFRPGFHPWDHDSRVQLDALRATFEQGQPVPA